MKSRLKSLGRIFLATTVLSTITLLPGGTATAATYDNPCWKFKKSERRFARLINNSRSDLGGLGKLKLDPELSRVAKKQARDMAKQGKIFHSPTTRLQNRITNWLTLGENVGVGATARSLHKAFMASPTHKANIVGPTYKNVGVFTVKRDGRLWVVVIFEGLRNPGTTFKMPTC